MKGKGDGNTYEQNIEPGRFENGKNALFIGRCISDLALGYKEIGEHSSKGRSPARGSVLTVLGILPGLGMRTSAPLSHDSIRR